MRRIAATIAAGALAALGCSEGRASFTSGPYVQDVRATSARICVQGLGGEGLTVAYGAEDGPLDRAASEAPTTGRAREALLPDLEPGTTYRYLATASNGRKIGEGRFRTDPGPGRRPVVFGIVGDTGAVDETDDDDLKKLKRLFGGRVRRQGVEGRTGALMAERDLDLVLHMGDVVYPKGEMEHYSEGFFRPLAPLIASAPLYPVLGNHDVRTGNGAPYLEVFHLPESEAGGERFYSFDHGDVHFVALDTESSSLEEGSPQVLWLREDLAATDRAWKVVFFHKPPLSDGPHGDNPASLALAPLFAAEGVDLVLSGHDHIYERFQPVDGVTYIVSGAGGAETYPVSGPRASAAYAEEVQHFLVARADATTLSIEAIDLAGAAFDAVRIVKAER